jgi:predicted metal-dependent hydrolase
MTTPTVRDFDEDLSTVPRHWMAGNRAATAISNGLNMLFPHGERFFVRSVNKFADRVSPGLQQQIKLFFGQEGRHARAHDEWNAVLREHGFEIDAFLARYHEISLWLETRVPAKLNLAGTAAAEHFTAILAEGAFAQGVLDAVDPKMKRLLAWHAAEEIEHKAVAFDVLREVDPSYAWRMAGLVYATTMLGGFWLWATIVLVRQEKMTWADFKREIGKMKRDTVLKRVFVTGIKQYMRRGFHPDDNDNAELATRWFAERGMTMPEAA